MKSMPVLKGVITDFARHSSDVVVRLDTGEHITFCEDILTICDAYKRYFPGGARYGRTIEIQASGRKTGGAIPFKVARIAGCCSGNNFRFATPYWEQDMVRFETSAVILKYWAQSLPLGTRRRIWLSMRIKRKKR